MPKPHSWNKIHAIAPQDRRPRHRHNRPLSEEGGTALCKLAAGEQGHIRRIGGGHTFTTRMATFGFTPGAQVEMLQNYGQGPVIVKVRGSRVALGRQEARRILVERNGEMPI